MVKDLEYGDSRNLRHVLDTCLVPGSRSYNGPILDPYLVQVNTVYSINPPSPLQAKETKYARCMSQQNDVEFRESKIKDLGNVKPKKIFQFITNGCILDCGVLF